MAKKNKEASRPVTAENATTANIHEIPLAEIAESARAYLQASEAHVVGINHGMFGDAAIYEGAIEPSSMKSLLIDILRRAREMEISLSKLGVRLAKG